MAKISSEGVKAVMTDVNLAKDVSAMTQDELNAALFKIAERGDTVATFMPLNGPPIIKNIHAEDYLRELQGAGADFSALNSEGLNLLDVAAVSGSPALLQQLTDEFHLPLTSHLPDNNLMVRAIANANLETARFIASRDPMAGSYINPDNGETLGHVAARTLDLETLKFVDRELHVDLSERSDTDYVSHMIARALYSTDEGASEGGGSYSKIVDALKYLHGRGVDLTAENAAGETVYDILNRSYFSSLKPDELEKDELYNFLKDASALIPGHQEVPEIVPAYHVDISELDSRLARFNALTGQNWVHAADPAGFIYLEIGDNKGLKDGIMSELRNLMDPEIMVHGPIIEGKKDILFFDAESFMRMSEADFNAAAQSLARLQAHEAPPEPVVPPSSRQDYSNPPLKI